MEEEEVPWVRVPASGRTNAPLVLISDAPSKDDVKHHPPTPLTGWAGKTLTEWMTAVGLRRADCYVLNLCEYQVPGNRLDALPREQVQPWIDYLHDRLQALDDPWLIVPMGNYALWALTGLGLVSWQKMDGREVRPGISKWRGSILSYTDRLHRTVKVIPTCHPGIITQQPAMEGPCRKDWARIKDDLTFRELRLPKREHVTQPTLGDIKDFRELAAQQAGDRIVSIDIENPKRRVKETWVDPLTEKTKKVTKWSEPEIVCVGFSTDPLRSITIPTTLSQWGSPDRLAVVWQEIKALCEDPRTEKAMHNSFYDRYHLAERGIQTVNMQWDTMFMSHAMDARDEHGLGYRGSVDTREPYWKSQGKDASLWEDFGNAWHAFLNYNGKDVCVTRELVDVYRRRMAHERRENGMTTLEFYQQFYVPLLEGLHELSRHGMRIDDGMRRRRLAMLMRDCIDIQVRLKELTGKELYGKKSLSGAKIKEFLYKDCQLPVQYAKRDKKGTRSVSSNEVALRKLILMLEKKSKQNTWLAGLMQQYSLVEVMNLILQHQRKAQLSTFYRTERIDPDGRFRSEYSPNTDAGRLSSKKNPKGTGSNAQNVDREARDMFLADEGMIALNVDASAAESRLDYLLIYHLTGNKEALYKARVRPTEYDQHAHAASDIFGVPPQQISESQRYYGKKVAHGIFRGVHGKKLSEEILKDGYVVTPEECQGWIETFKTKVGGIDELFKFFRREVLTKGYIENTWGRRLLVPEISWNRLGMRKDLADELWRMVYSFWPQSECADLINQYGFLPLWRELRGQPEVARINAHVHDSLFTSVVPERAYDVAKFLVESLERPRMLYGVELRMPCTIEIGMTWKGTVKWKELPSRQVFEEAVAAVFHGSGVSESRVPRLDIATRGGQGELGGPLRVEQG